MLRKLVRTGSALWRRPVFICNVRYIAPEYPQRTISFCLSNKRNRAEALRGIFQSARLGCVAVSAAFFQRALISRPGVDAPQEIRELRPRLVEATAGACHFERKAHHDIGG